MAKRRSSDGVGFMLRLPAPLHRMLEREAEKNHRSLNGELVHRLLKSVTKTEIEEAMERVLDAAFDRLNITSSGKKS